MNKKHLIWIVPCSLLVGVLFGSFILFEESKSCPDINCNSNNAIYNCSTCEHNLELCNNFSSWRTGYIDELLVENVQYRNILKWHFNYSIDQPYLYADCSTDNGFNEAINCVNSIEGRIVLDRLE